MLSQPIGRLGPVGELVQVVGRAADEGQQDGANGNAENVQQETHFQHVHSGQVTVAEGDCIWRCRNWEAELVVLISMIILNTINLYKFIY